MWRFRSYVRREIQLELDMRIGVHSGSVLCGVLGLQKWQFDIWSWDVDVASSLEAAGVPGSDARSGRASAGCLLVLPGFSSVLSGEFTSRGPLWTAWAGPMRQRWATAENVVSFYVDTTLTHTWSTQC